MVEKVSQQMNKQQILEQIDELKQKIEELEKEVNSPDFDEVKKGVRQKPKVGERYFYVDSCGSIDYEFWQETETDLFRFNTGNCFKTEQEAEDYKENLLTKQALKDLALELNNGVEIDWNDYSVTKYYIYFKESQDLLFYDGRDCCDYLKNLNVYCLNSDFFKIAKDRIGEEKLIKLIKSGV